MRTRIRALLLSLVKLTLTVAAMVYLSFLLLVLLVTTTRFGTPPPDDSVEGGHAMGWIVMPIFLIMAIFIVSTVVGMLFTRDRWLIRPAAIVSTGLFLGYEIYTLVDLLRIGLHTEASLTLRFSIIPIVCTAVIAGLFSPFFYDCARRLRGATLKR